VLDKCYTCVDINGVIVLKFSRNGVLQHVFGIPAPEISSLIKQFVKYYSLL